MAFFDDELGKTTPPRRRSTFQNPDASQKDQNTQSDSLAARRRRSDSTPQQPQAEEQAVPTESVSPDPGFQLDWDWGVAGSPPSEPATSAPTPSDSQDYADALQDFQRLAEDESHTSALPQVPAEPVEEQELPPKRPERSWDEPPAQQEPAPLPSPEPMITPPQRKSIPQAELEEIMLASLEGRASDTLPLIEILEDELKLREREAAEFLSWEQEVLAEGSPESIQAVQQARQQYQDLVPNLPDLPVLPEPAPAPGPTEPELRRGQWEPEQQVAPSSQWAEATAPALPDEGLRGSERVEPVPAPSFEAASPVLPPEPAVEFEQDQPAPQPWNTGQNEPWQPEIDAAVEDAAEPLIPAEAEAEWSADFEPELAAPEPELAAPDFDQPPVASRVWSLDSPSFDELLDDAETTEQPESLIETDVEDLSQPVEEQDVAAGEAQDAPVIPTFDPGLSHWQAPAVEEADAGDSEEPERKFSFEQSVPAPEEAAEEHFPTETEEALPSVFAQQAAEPVLEDSEGVAELPERDQLAEEESPREPEPSAAGGDVSIKEQVPEIPEIRLPASQSPGDDFSNPFASFDAILAGSNVTPIFTPEQSQTNLPELIEPSEPPVEDDEIDEIITTHSGGIELPDLSAVPRNDLIQAQRRWSIAQDDEAGQGQEEAQEPLVLSDTDGGDTATQAEQPQSDAQSSSAETAQPLEADSGDSEASTPGIGDASFAVDEPGNEAVDDTAASIDALGGETSATSGETELSADTEQGADSETPLGAEAEAESGAESEAAQSQDIQVIDVKPSSPVLLKEQRPLLETVGILPTLVQQRVGGAVKLFWLWFGINSSLVTLLVSAYIFNLGLSLRQTIIAILGGVILSAVPLALTSLAGKRSGQPTMIVSRATFGLSGNILPVIVTLITRLFWAAVLLWIAVLSVTEMMRTARYLTHFNIDENLVTGIALVVVAAIFGVFSILGYRMLTALLYVSAIGSLLLLAGFIVMTWHLVDINAALSVGDGSWYLTVTGAAVIISFLGVAWANSGSDLARYHSPLNSSLGAAAGPALGAVIPSLLLLGYGALLAASDPELGSELLANPIGALAAMVPGDWYPIPLLLAVVLSIIAGLVVSSYSAGLGLLSTGIRISQPVAQGIVFVLILAAAYGVTFISGVGGNVLDFASLLAVPLGAWLAILSTDILLRTQRYDSASLLRRGGVYPNFAWVNLIGFAVITAIGYGFTHGDSPLTQWQGYLFGLTGIPAEHPIVFSDVGVIVAAFLGFVLVLATGIPRIRAEEKAVAVKRESQEKA